MGVWPPANMHLSTGFLGLMLGARSAITVPSIITDGTPRPFCFPRGLKGLATLPLNPWRQANPFLRLTRPAHNELMPDGHCLGAEDEDAWREAIQEVHARWVGSERGRPGTRPGLSSNTLNFCLQSVSISDMSDAWAEISSS